MKEYMTVTMSVFNIDPTFKKSAMEMHAEQGWRIEHVVQGYIKAVSQYPPMCSHEEPRLILSRDV